MEQSTAGFTVLLKPIEGSCPSSLPSLVFFLFSLSPHQPVFFMMPLPDPGSSPQQGPAPSVPHLHTPPGCLIWPCCPSAPCIVMLQPFPAFSALPIGSLSRPQHVCWPRCPGVAGTMCSTASCLRGVQRMHRTLRQQCPAICEAARQQRLLCSSPHSSPHCGLSRRLSQGRAGSHQGVVLGNVSLSQLQPKNGFRWGEDWGKNALGFWTALPKNSAFTPKRSLSPFSSYFFQHYVQPLGQGVKLELNRKNLFNLLFSKRQLSLNGYFDILICTQIRNRSKKLQSQLNPDWIWC